MAVVDQNTTLLQEIPLFPSQEPINNILLHQVEHTQLFPHTHLVLSRIRALAPCLQGRALVGSPLFLAQVRAGGCGLFPSCEVCARARGLGCAWSAKEEACTRTTAE